MYVLIDMEWVTNRHGNHWPTQLAAIRVDKEWNTVDSFSVLFRPKDITFQKWDHMAFSGWSRDDFLNADSLYPALDAFAETKSNICIFYHLTRCMNGDSI